MSTQTHTHTPPNEIMAYILIRKIKTREKKPINRTKNVLHHDYVVLTWIQHGLCDGITLG